MTYKEALQSVLMYCAEECGKKEVLTNGRV